MQRVDVHQHLLSEPLIAELARRRRAPALIRRRGGWTLRIANAPDSLLSFDAINFALREVEMRRSGIDLALIALSTTLGIETLPAEEALPLLEAHHQGLETLPAQFGVWGAVQLEAPDPDEVDALIARGCIGISLPASALASPGALERIEPLLARLEHHEAPLFVHPGPLPGSDRTGDATSQPSFWWPALSDHAAQMRAAWLAFLNCGRRAHPRLRMLFAMLAGGAPLRSERHADRDGAACKPDPLVFYDTSSHEQRMVKAMARAVGAGQLVYGSDRPTGDARPPRPDLGEALLSANPCRLLSPAQGGVLA